MFAEVNDGGIVVYIKIQVQSVGVDTKILCHRRQAWVADIKTKSLRGFWWETVGWREGSLFELGGCPFEGTRVSSPNSKRVHGTVVFYTIQCGRPSVMFNR